jgi:hypothetical protein
VLPNTGWIVFEHNGSTPVQHEDVIQVSDNLAVSASRELLESLVQARGKERLLLVLGYAGWGPAQLDSEISQGAWIPVDFDHGLVFDTPYDERWGASLRSLGIDPARLSLSAPGARAFDMGERAQFQLMPMAIAAIEQILDWGVENIAATLTERTTAIAARAEALGLRAAPADQRAGHYLGLRFRDGVPGGLLDQLVRRRVYVSGRGDSVRVTPHLYTTESDVDRFFEALEEVL